MSNPYSQGSVKHREYAAGFACGMGNAAAGFEAGGLPHWSEAYSKGYSHGFEWESTGRKRFTRA